MAYAKVSVGREADDKVYWVVTLSVKHFGEVEIFQWLRRFDVEKHVSISISRRRPLRPAAPRLRRAYSLSDLLHIPERTSWITVRIIGEGDREPFGVYDSCFHGTVFASALNKMTDVADYCEFSGARPCVRRGAKPGATLELADLLSLEEHCDAQNSALKAEADARAHFRDLLERDGAATMEHATLSRIAVQHELLGGHWSIYCRKDDRAQRERDRQTWRRLLASFLLGPLAKSAATQLLGKLTADGRSVSVSNERCVAIERPMAPDECDADVFAVEAAIRDSWVRAPLKYKPDVFSACQITHANQKIIRPTIYQSVFHRDISASCIVTDYTLGYTPTVTMGADRGFWNRFDPSERPPAFVEPRRHPPRSFANQRARPAS